MKKIFKDTKGFTLIELLVVIAIIGILGAIVYAPFQTARRKGRDAQKIVEIKNIYSSLLLYADSNNGSFPKTLSDLQASQSDKLPANANTSGTSTDLSKYNYTSYQDAQGKVLGFHLFTHLETKSPALSGSARCYLASNSSIATTSSSFCLISPTYSTTGGSDETTNGDIFTDRTQDSDSKCATQETLCIYDIRG